MRGDQIVDVCRMIGHPARHRHRVRVERRHVGLVMCQRIPSRRHLGRCDASRLGLEQQVDGALACLVPTAVAHPVRH
jgi:hypothetical protein